MLLCVKLQPQQIKTVEMRAKTVQQIKYEKLGFFYHNHYQLELPA